VKAKKEVPMPKIKDLGIKLIPETMQPLEAGGGAGCGVSVQAQICPLFTRCIGCSFRICSYLNTWCRWGSCWCSFVSPVVEQCPLHSVACEVGTHGGGCGAISPVCGGSMDPTIVQQPVEFTRDQISALKEQLQEQIAALDEHAKTIGPRTAEEIDAREKQLNQELADLRSRRKELDKK
jgi:hypothetical protein